METNDIRSRIKIIMDKVSQNSITFAETIGIQQSTLSHIINGRNRASLDVIMKIHQRFPEISYDWLISGSGEMYSEKNVTESQSLQASNSNVLYNKGNNSLDLFSQNEENPVSAPTNPIFRQGMALKSSVEPTKEIVRQEIKYVEKPCKKITEIRIFFDDNTYQIFTCEK